MIYTDIMTLYITSENNQRLVRYDVVKKSDDDYFVKVFDEQTKGIADPKILIQVDEFEVTQQNYRVEYDIGGPQKSVKISIPPTFEGYLRHKLQDHRNKLD
ncbi:hypothetical protein PYX08_20220 [Citrobacter freundii]|nr:hypothetical protein [Citrobacter freundii]